ncbi:hypothetical protein H072_5157 [Dactylellina haptotyla CBS 200.50]|uniref:Killer toxin Kp4 domain-containing protein n=1 Tax=Dactylellina haptotyla (strain CBS 200.50) TaxID=1284197 RepID=S8ADD1_DACHA|nr:hypothetical protein H072_5157 [Dactylellina haptotyla CBS 200.50]
MKFFTTISLFSLFMTSALAVASPAPSAVAVLETSPSSPLMKRETIDCKGSSLCHFLNGDHCRQAFEEGFADSVTYYSEVRRVVIQFDLFKTYCLAMFTCENPDDYAWGKTGAELKERFRNLKTVSNCEKCGTNWFWGSCRVTLNYCSGKGCGTA